MRPLNPRGILIGTLVVTVVVELIVAVLRFGFDVESVAELTPGLRWMTAGIQLHHGFLGLLLLLFALLLRKRRTTLVPWLIVFGLGLVLSDVIHHFVVMVLVRGDSEFHLFYPEPSEEHTSTARLLSWTVMLFLVEWIIRITMLLTITYEASQRPAVSSLAWLTAIFFLPEMGLLLYLLIGRATMPAWRLARMRRLRHFLGPVRERLALHPNITRPRVDPELHPAIRLATSLGHFPILGGNSVELITNYDEGIDRLVADIDGARDHVHLLYYIFASDKCAGRILGALERAVRRGVTCRVLVDAFGSKGYLKCLMPKLREIGVRACEVLPVGLFGPKVARMDLRNHRKVAVIDGRIGYTGSQNLVDAKFKEDITYEELVARVTGPVVLELQAVFVGDWYLETEEALDTPQLFPDPVITGQIAAQVLPADPSFPQENIQRLIVALLHASRQRVVITTPYFIPDDPLLQAMQTAVMRGVEVHLVVSEKMDQLLVGLAQRSYYDNLLEMGVHIHVYRFNFLHAKHVTFDDHIALIGSTNMDIRSFRLNAEICLLCYDNDVTAKLHEIHKTYFRRCSLLEQRKWKKRHFFRRIAQNLARLFSPLL